MAGDRCVAPFCGRNRCLGDEPARRTAARSGMTPLILASGSESRAKLLRNAGMDFDVIPAHVDEDAIKDSMRAAKQPHRAVADALAELKARRVSSNYPQHVVIGADQVLSFNGWLVSKCETMRDARNLLMELRGKTH